MIVQRMRMRFLLMMAVEDLERQRMEQSIRIDKILAMKIALKVTFRMTTTSLRKKLQSKKRNLMERTLGLVVVARSKILRKMMIRY